MSVPHLLLVPGLNCTGNLFAAQVKALSGRCSIQIGEHRQHDSMAAIAAHILRQAPARFALAGLSMGGYVAFEILRQAPKRVERLMLLNTNARADNDEQRAIRQRSINLVAAGEFRQVYSANWPRLVHESRVGDASLRQTGDEMAEETGAEAYIRQQTAILNRVDSRPFLSSITCPVTVLVGDGDMVTPVKVAQEMEAGIAGSRLMIVRDCGHLSPLEKPEAVTDVMMDWLA